MEESIRSRGQALGLNESGSRRSWPAPQAYRAADDNMRRRKKSASKPEDVVVDRRRKLSAREPAVSSHQVFRCERPEREYSESARGEPEGGMENGGSSTVALVDFCIQSIRG